jgi:hypothetical protein
MNSDKIIKERAISYVSDALANKILDGERASEEDRLRVCERIRNTDLCFFTQEKAVELLIEWIMPLPGASKEELGFLLRS